MTQTGTGHNGKAATMTYNGWTNYETWAVKLWLDNEHGSYTDMTERAAELHRQHTEDLTDADELAGAEQTAAREMADYVKETLEEGNPLEEASASVYADLLRAAMSEVNWDEIGQSYIGDAKESAGA